LVNECFVLSSAALAAMFAQDWPGDYTRLKAELPAWTLFYVVAGYDYFPEERVSVNVKEISTVAMRVGVEAAKAVGGLSARDIMKAVQSPAPDPYWKLNYKGASEDVFFLAQVEKLPSLIGIMDALAAKAGYPVADRGVYIQPAVQGTSYHCEFNLPYDPADPKQVQKVKSLAAGATKSLIDGGAFFSRPYGDNARAIMNRDAATVEVLKKLKQIFDPNAVMNPGKLCF
jgi:hypothetical protein